MRNSILVSMDDWWYTPLGVMVYPKGTVVKKATYVRKYGHDFAKGHNLIRKSFRSGIHKATSGKGFDFVAPIASALELPMAYISGRSDRKCILLANLTEQQASEAQAALLLSNGTGREVSMVAHWQSVQSNTTSRRLQAAQHLEGRVGWNSMWSVLVQYQAYNRTEQTNKLFSSTSDYVSKMVLSYDTESTRGIRTKIDRWLATDRNLNLLYSIDHPNSDRLAGWHGSSVGWIDFGETK
tara:strand:- start:637 stop:1353 length:717 start_codon:yes stop_codon:yes gene_type:complete